MKTFETYFHFVTVTLFPSDDYAFIHFAKCGYNYQTKDNFNLKTDRKVPFDYAVKYLNRYHMKMEQNKDYKYMFRAVKG